MDVEKYEYMKITVHMWLFHDFFSVSLPNCDFLSDTLVVFTNIKDEEMNSFLNISSFTLNAPAQKHLENSKGKFPREICEFFLYRTMSYFFFLLNQVVLHSRSLNKTDHKYSLKF